ncbi:MAG: serine/threonine-protein kinase [Myxococcota bacterium]
MGTTSYTGASADQSEEGLAFLQHRVAWYGLVGGGLGLAFLLFRVAGILVNGNYQAFLHPTVLTHLCGAGALLVLWPIARTGRRSLRFLLTAEVLASLASAECYLWMGAYLEPYMRPDLIVALALTLGAVARAVYVPSTQRRTLLLNIAIGVGLVAMAYTVSNRASPEYIAVVQGSVPEFGSVTISKDRLVWGTVASAAAWWALTTLLVSSASRVIYGLRREANQAKKLGQYTLVEQIGEGGMGSVWRAQHAMLRRPTALKLLPPERAGEAAVGRFEREVQLTASLTHPNTVTIFDYGRTPDNIFYYVMELLDGSTLDEAVRVGGPMPPARVIHILRQAVGGLAEAHGVGLIHRDIKPANIMLCVQGGVHDFVKVVDFGLVKELQNAEAQSLSVADTISGTPQYMAPEAITDPTAVDGRADLYALGAVGYFLLTGEHLFSGATLIEVCSHHLHTEPKPPSKRSDQEIPEALESLVMSLLQKVPEQRSESARDLLRALEGLALDHPWTEPEASGWWREFGADLKTPTRKAAATRTIEVNLDRPARRLRAPGQPAKA